MLFENVMAYFLVCSPSATSRQTKEAGPKAVSVVPHFSLSEIFSRSSNVPRRNSSSASAAGAVLSKVNAAFGCCFQTARSSAVTVSYPNLNI
jgi:hypothetical protein